MYVTDNDGNNEDSDQNVLVKAAARWFWWEIEKLVSFRLC